MPIYLFVVLFLHSRTELNFIIKEAVSFGENDTGLVVPVKLRDHLPLPPKHLSLLFVAM